MNSSMWIKWAKNKYDRFLFLLFWLLISITLPERQVTTTCTILILFLVTMLSTVRQIRPGQWWLKYYAALVLLNIVLLVFQVLGLLNISTWSHGYSVMAFILFIVVFVFILLLQQEFFLTPNVTADTLKGGIAIYVLMGVAWAMVYTIVFDFNPDSFEGIQLSRFRADLLHFSFVTLTTLGYGNIVPTESSVRLVSDLEAIAGILYPAILISRLVNQYTSNAKDNTKEIHDGN